MDNFVTVVQGNDFTLNITLSTPNKETQAPDPYDIRDAESIEVKLVSQINGHVLRLDPFKIVGKNVISTLVSGTKLKLTDYDVEVSFVKGGLNKRAYECNIIHVVRCQGDTDYSTQDTEGENGYGIDLTMGIDLEVVNLGKNVNGSGTLDYNNLEHKPSINDVVLEGNKTLEDLGIMGSDKAYTKEEVNQALETKADKTLVDTFSQKVDSLEESLNRKANTTDIPSRLSELENDLKTKTINGQSIFGEGNMEIPSGQDNVIEKIKVNGTELPVENKEVNIKVPTKVSELDNDSHFLSEHQDLSNYVQKEMGKGLSTNDLTDERAGKVDKLKTDGRANEYLNGAGIYSRPVRQGYGVSVADDNTVSVDPQVIARQSDVANVAAALDQYAKTAEVTEMINQAVVAAINTEI